VNDYYGWFSQKHADAGHQTVIYRDSNGVEHECGFVSQDPTYGSAICWDDLIFLGVVGQYARVGRPDASERRHEKLPRLSRELSEEFIKDDGLKSRIKALVMQSLAESCDEPIIVYREKTDGSDHAG
jgi:hypothetical protein